MHIFLGLEDFALARVGQQKQTNGKGFRPIAFFQRPYESLCLVLREIAFPLRVDFEGRDARVLRLELFNFEKGEKRGGGTAPPGQN